MRGYGYGFSHRLRRDPDMVAGKSVDRAVVRRVLRFARPYRRLLLALVATIWPGRSSASCPRSSSGASSTTTPCPAATCPG